MVKVKLYLKKHVTNGNTKKTYNFIKTKYDILRIQKKLNLSHYEVIFGNPQPTQFFHGTYNQPCVLI